MQPKDDMTLETHPSRSEQLQREMDKLRDIALVDWDQVMQEIYGPTRERI